MFMMFDIPGLYLIARIADCDFYCYNECSCLRVIISYCTHSGLRPECCRHAPPHRWEIISYCTHSGLRLILSVEIEDLRAGGLYLIARIADCDFGSLNGDTTILGWLYLIARIADCDFWNWKVRFFNNLIISYCTHSGLRREFVYLMARAVIRLYLIARIADCDMIFIYTPGVSLYRLYLIARIADCDYRCSSPSLRDYRDYILLHA